MTDTNKQANRTGERRSLGERMDAAWQSSAYQGVVWVLAAAMILMGAFLGFFVGSDGAAGAFIEKHEFATRMLPIVWMIAMYAMTWDLDEHEEYWKDVTVLVAAFMYFIIVDYGAQMALGFSLGGLKWIWILAPLFAISLWVLDCWFESERMHAVIALLSVYLGFFVAGGLENGLGLMIVTWGIGAVLISFLLFTAFKKEA